MKPNQKQLKEIQEEFPYFLEKAVATGFDRDGQKLTDEEIVNLISLDFDKITNYIKDSYHCNTCNTSHGTLCIVIDDDKRYCIQAW